jgi:hypothetical protein
VREILAPDQAPSRPAAGGDELLARRRRSRTDLAMIPRLAATGTASLSRHDHAAEFCDPRGGWYTETPWAPALRSRRGGLDVGEASCAQTPPPIFLFLLSARKAVTTKAGSYLGKTLVIIPERLG